LCNIINNEPPFKGYFLYFYWQKDFICVQKMKWVMPWHDPTT
jgi:hypothetical protein